MKLNKKILICLMTLFAAGGVGSTYAMTHTGATKSGNGVGFDQAIELNWSTGSSTISIDAVSNLGIGEANSVYRWMSVTPKSTKSVAGNVKLTFTLATEGENAVLNGLSVNAYKVDDLTSVTDDASAKTKVGTSSAVITVDKNTTEDDTTFAVSSSTTAHETNAYYIMKFTYSGEDLGGKNLNAKLTIAQSFELGA